MASIYKRKDTDGKKGKPSWRAVIRIKGYPTVSKTPDRKQELIDWAQETERQIKSGQFNFDHTKINTLSMNSSIDTSKTAS